MVTIDGATRWAMLGMSLQSFWCLPEDDRLFGTAVVDEELELLSLEQPTNVRATRIATARGAFVLTWRQDHSSRGRASPAVNGRLRRESGGRQRVEQLGHGGSHVLGDALLTAWRRVERRLALEAAGVVEVVDRQPVGPGC